MFRFNKLIRSFTTKRIILNDSVAYKFNSLKKINIINNTNSNISFDHNKDQNIIDIIITPNTSNTQNKEIIDHLNKVAKNKDITEYRNRIPHPHADLAI